MTVGARLCVYVFALVWLHVIYVASKSLTVDEAAGCQNDAISNSIRQRKSEAKQYTAD